MAPLGVPPAAVGLQSPLRRLRSVAAVAPLGVRAGGRGAGARDAGEAATLIAVRGAPPAGGGCLAPLVLTGHTAVPVLVQLVAELIGLCPPQAHHIRLGMLAGSVALVARDRDSRGGSRAAA